MKLIDLTYLKKVSNNDTEMMLEMIDIFEEQCSEFIAEFNQNLENNNYNDLSLLAHKVKSSVAIMGMNNFANELKVFEKQTKAGENKETYKETVEGFINTFKKTIIEIEELKTKLKS